jgi:hypothetical protein
MSATVIVTTKVCEGKWVSAVFDEKEWGTLTIAQLRTPPVFSMAARLIVLGCCFFQGSALAKQVGWPTLGFVYGGTSYHPGERDILHCADVWPDATKWTQFSVHCFLPTGRYDLEKAERYAKAAGIKFVPEHHCSDCNRPMTGSGGSGATLLSCHLCGRTKNIAPSAHGSPPISHT